MNDLTHTDYGVEFPARFSAEEFQQLADTGIFEGSRVELVEGVIVRMSPAMSRHMGIQRQLAFDLHAIFRDGINGWIAAFEATVRFGEKTLRDLDVAVIKGLGDTESYLEPANILLAIEISSTTLRYDLNEKRIDYARGGIPHYWVVDVNAECVHVASDAVDDDYVARRRVRFGEALDVPGTEASVIVR